MNNYSVVFDLGGVLIDWNPRYLYRKMMNSEAEIDYFLNHICTTEWNEQQDAGRTFGEAVAILKKQYPEYSTYIEAYDNRWHEMLGDPDWRTVKIVQQLKQANVPVYALSNWSAEKYPHARKRFSFLDLFEDIIVSGEINIKKPDPAIFRFFLNKHHLQAEKTIFIDDVEQNVLGAKTVGMKGIVFQDSHQLRQRLKDYGFELNN